MQKRHSTGVLIRRFGICYPTGTPTSHANNGARYQHSNVVGSSVSPGVSTTARLLISSTPVQYFYTHRAERNTCHIDSDGHKSISLRLAKSSCVAVNPESTPTSSALFAYALAVLYDRFLLHLSIFRSLCLASVVLNTSSIWVVSLFPYRPSEPLQINLLRRERVFLQCFRNRRLQLAQLCRSNPEQ